MASLFFVTYQANFIKPDPGIGGFVPLPEKMYVFLVSLVIGLFVAMLFLNIYFRIKVLRSYKLLVQNKVDFDPLLVFNLDRMRAEVLPRYPQMATEILTFANHLRYSIKMATVLLALITAFGAILMQYGRT
jgi:hypothetical protein